MKIGDRCSLLYSAKERGPGLAGLAFFEGFVVVDFAIGRFVTLLSPRASSARLSPLTLLTTSSRTSSPRPSPLTLFTTSSQPPFSSSGAAFRLPLAVPDLVEKFKEPCFLGSALLGSAGGASRPLLAVISQEKRRPLSPLILSASSLASSLVRCLPSLTTTTVGASSPNSSSSDRPGGGDGRVGIGGRSL
jgi:hypothetical protein